MKMIVGLGNPGKKYHRTRHNIGFMVLDFLHDSIAERTGIPAWKVSPKFNAEIADYKVKGESVLLLKPLTFMNDSGHSVQLAAQFYKIAPADILVVHDEKDLPLGEIKLQTSRGHAGHNGVRSIIECLGTKDFMRLRLGVANDQLAAGMDTAVFVLNKFGVRERGALNTLTENAVQHISDWITQ